MSAAPPAIEVRDVYKSHGATQVLRSIDLVVPQGAVTAVLGASGSGKTTLLRLIAGFDTVDTGSLSIAGRLVDDGRSTLRAQHRGIGYVPQDAALFPHLSVLANVGFGVRRRDRSRVADLLGLVGLSGYEHRYPHQLSGGQQQRVALARALAVQPAVVLLDEPFSSLDAALRETVRADTARILADTRTTTVLVTHDQDEALSLADHLVLIDAGRVTASGSPHDLYEHPPTPDVAAAIGVANIIPGHAAGDLVRSPLGDLTATARPSFAATGTPCHVLVRPEQLRLTTEPDARGVTARLHRTRYLGHDTLVELVVDAGRRGDAMHLTARVPGRSAAQPGQLVGVTVLGDVHVWP